MPNINLRDARNRDAMVSAESVAEYAKVNYVDKDGAPAKSRKVLKAVGEMSFDKLATQAGDPDKLADVLVGGDSDIDVERIGMFLSETSRVFVNAKDEIVYQVEQVEIVRGPTGDEKERRPRRRVEPNIDGDIPISWTGRKVAKDEALRKFVFSSKLQIMHVNGLTYDFLYGMANELADTKSLMLLGAGKSGKEPLIFRRGQTAYRGFLEGRIDGDKYILILHLSKMELKRPVVVMPEVAATAPTAEAQPIATATIVPTPPPEPQAPALVPLAATPSGRKPTAKEVISELGGPTPATDAKGFMSETVAAAKSAKRSKTKTAVSATVSATASEKTAPEPTGDAIRSQPARKPRAPKTKPPAETTPD